MTNVPVAWQVAEQYGRAAPASSTGDDTVATARTPPARPGFSDGGYEQSGDGSNKPCSLTGQGQTGWHARPTALAVLDGPPGALYSTGDPIRVLPSHLLRTTLE